MTARRITLLIITCSLLVLAAIIGLALVAQSMRRDNARQDDLIDQMQATQTAQQKSLEEANKRLEQAGKPTVEVPPPPVVTEDQGGNKTIIVQGTEGAQGPAGPRGPVGPRGLAGVGGKTGAPGQTGATGPAGVNGSDGQDGVDGAPGEGGPPGDVGPQGPAGPAGADGKDGADGKNGRGITSLACTNDRLIVTYTDDTSDDIAACTSDPTPTPVPAQAVK